MNEAKRAAVVKRGAERDHRDLFASRPADLGSVKQTLRPPPPDALFGGVAARNESSVLFTVDALRGAARMKTPEPEPAVPPSTAFIANDDEGVIDLMSLSSAPPKVGARSVAPLFSEPPPAAFATDVGASSSGVVGSMPNGFKFGKRAIAGLAAAAVAVVLCSVGLAAAFKGEEPVARAANAAMAPIAPPAPVAPAVVAPAAPVIASATTPAASTDDDEKVSTPAKGKGKAGKGKGKKAQSGGFASTKSKSSSSEPLVSKPTPKAADKCGCKGDFTCILRCTAKGS